MFQMNIVKDLLKKTATDMEATRIIVAEMQESIKDLKKTLYLINEKLKTRGNKE